MRRFSYKRLAIRLNLALAMLIIFSGTAIASHWAASGWFDRHYNYPDRPSGRNEIIDRFGQPCGNNASFNQFLWGAEGESWQLNYHKKLGGAETPGWYPGNGGSSTNLHYDIRGHIANNHWDDRILGGVFGYQCRKIEGTDKWSTHAWGIAMDMNARYEHVGHRHNHTVDGGVANIFESHGWEWGLDFRDAMHFQYATDY